MRGWGGAGPKRPSLAVKSTARPAYPHFEGKRGAGVASCGGKRPGHPGPLTRVRGYENPVQGLPVGVLRSWAPRGARMQRPCLRATVRAQPRGRLQRPCLRAPFRAQPRGPPAGERAQPRERLQRPCLRALFRAQPRGPPAGEKEPMQGRHLGGDQFGCPRGRGRSATSWRRTTGAGARKSPLSRPAKVLDRGRPAGLKSWSSRS